MIVLQEIISGHVVDSASMDIEISDQFLMSNRDWDPAYLQTMFCEDFNSCSELWQSNVSDVALINKVEETERYCPITEDISIED